MHMHVHDAAVSEVENKCCHFMHLLASMSTDEQWLVPKEIDEKETSRGVPENHVTSASHRLAPVGYSYNSSSTGPRLGIFI